MHIHSVVTGRRPDNKIILSCLASLSLSLSLRTPPPPLSCVSVPEDWFHMQWRKRLTSHSENWQLLFYCQDVMTPNSPSEISVTHNGIVR